MLKNPLSNKYLVLFVVIILILVTFKITQHISDKKLEAQRIELKRLKIKNDTLQKVADGQYTKLVADTAKIKDLNKLVKELQIKADNPLIVEKIVLVPETVEKPIDSVSIAKDSVTIVDYYPTKQDWFIKYNGKIDLIGTNNKGSFTFSELPISLVISEQEDGTFKSDLKAPPFINITQLDVVALPLETKKADNFGFLAGGKINRNMSNGNLGYEILGGVRFKKINVITSINTNEEFGIGTLIEF